MDGWRALLLAGLVTLALKVGDTLVKALDRYVDHRLDDLLDDDDDDDGEVGSKHEPLDS